MADTKKPSEYPFQVWAVPGVIVSGHDDESVAKSSAKERNSNAEKLDLKTRYEVRAA